MRAALTLDDHRALAEAGALLLDYLGQDTYVVSLPTPVDMEEAPYASVVSWAGGFQPADKLHPDLLAKEGDDRIQALVVFFEDVGSTAAADALRIAKLEWSIAGDPSTLQVETSLEQLRSLAREDSVSIIVPAAPPPRPSSDTVRALVRTDAVQQPVVTAGNIAYGGRTGEGIRIGICDFGFDEDDADFKDLDGTSPCADPGGRRVYVSRPDTADAHGTRVASIAAGNGAYPLLGSYPPFALRGHAPRACLADYPSNSGDFWKNWVAVVLDRTDVTNHSYLLGGGPAYSDYAQQVDRVVRGGRYLSVPLPLAFAIPSRPQVWAAGNFGVDYWPGTKIGGYYAVGVAAKNAICVGSVDTTDVQLSAFSSLGPTCDGRLKPDLVAPGARASKGGQKLGILTASSTATDRVGTSYAAPVVTGTIALMMEALQDAGGAQRSVRASTFRAILIHTADDLVSPASGLDIDNPDTEPHPVNYGAGPDYATGFGLVNAESACSTIASLWRWTEEWMSVQGEDREFCFEVPPGASVVKVTLAWDDLPGSIQLPPTSSVLVDDLDLTLIDPNGQEHLPWIVDPPPQSTDGDDDPIGATVPSASPGIDRRNNVEMVSLTGPSSGHWIARVRADRLPLGTSQPYSLVASQDLSPCWSDIFPGGAFCELVPWLCDRPFPSIPPFDPASREWAWESRSILPLSELRKIVGLPPLHDDRAWLPRPGFEVVVRPLAGGTILVLLDQSGAIVARGHAQEGEGRVRAQSVSAEARLFLLLTDENWRPISGPSSLEIDVETWN